MKNAVHIGELVACAVPSDGRPAVCAVTGLPLAWQVETASRNESLFALPLLDAARARGFAAETCAMDKGYDHNRVYDECHEHGIAPVIQPETPITRGTSL